MCEVKDYSCRCKPDVKMDGFGRVSNRDFRLPSVVILAIGDVYDEKGDKSMEACNIQLGNSAVMNGIVYNLVSVVYHIGKELQYPLMFWFMGIS